MKETIINNIKKKTNALFENKEYNNTNIENIDLIELFEYIASSYNDNFIIDEKVKMKKEDCIKSIKILLSVKKYINNNFCLYSIKDGFLIESLIFRTIMFSISMVERLKINKQYNEQSSLFSTQYNRTDLKIFLDNFYGKIIEIFSFISLKYNGIINTNDFKKIEFNIYTTPFVGDGGKDINNIQVKSWLFAENTDFDENIYKFFLFNKEIENWKKRQPDAIYMMTNLDGFVILGNYDYYSSLQNIYKDRKNNESGFVEETNRKKEVNLYFYDDSQNKINYKRNTTKGITFLKHEWTKKYFEQEKTNNKKLAKIINTNKQIETFVNFK